MEAGLGKSSPKLPRKLIANKSRTLTKVKGRHHDDTEDTPAQGISRSNSRLSAHGGANNLDEALKIVRGKNRFLQCNHPNFVSQIFHFQLSQSSLIWLHKLLPRIEFKFFKFNGWLSISKALFEISQ